MKIYSYMLLCGAALLSACSNDNEPAAPAGKTEISLECLMPTQSRATDLAFENGDQIGLYVTPAGSTLQLGGNTLNNQDFSFDGNTWTAARKTYWDAGTYDVYAYYPYAATVNDIEDYTFEMVADQSTHAGYTAADFMWAKSAGVTASANVVKLRFSHCMSKVIVKLEKSDDYEGELPTDCEVFIHSTAATASIDLASGSVSSDSYSGTTTIKALKNSNTEYQAIVVPQNIESRRPLVEVVTGGVSYLMEGKISFKQGYQHTLVVTLTKNPEQTMIDIGGSIGGWN